MRLIVPALVFAGLMVVASPSASQTMCFGNGERVSGMNKICSYDCLGSPRETTIGAAQLCPLSIKAPSVPGPAPAQSSFGSGLMCFKSGERSMGMSKICSYDCAGSEASITIGNVQLCPLNIKR